MLQRILIPWSKMMKGHALKMLVALLSAQASVVLADTVVLPFQEIAASDESGHAVLDVAAGQVGAALTTFDSTSLELATTGTYALTANAGDVFDPSSGRAQFFLLKERYSQLDDLGNPYLLYAPRVLIAELLAGTSPGVVLYVGVDTNRDGKPQAGELLCQSEFTVPSSARCVLGPEVLQGSDQVYWVMAAAPVGTGASYSANLSAALPSVPQPIFDPFGPKPSGPPTTLSGHAVTVTGPGLVAANLPFQARMTWIQGAPAANRYYAAVLMGSGELTNLIDNAAAMLPFALVRAVAPDTMAHPIPLDPVTGMTADDFNLQPGETQRRIFFDLPPSASAYDSIRVNTGLVLQDPVDVEFSAIHSDFPPASADAIVAEAPQGVTPAASWNALTPAFPNVIPHPASGRWYIVVTNHSSSPVTVAISLWDASNPDAPFNAYGRAANPLIAPGSYFNLQRSGHGITLSRGADQQLLLWYTYLEDGTPTWYIAQATAPAADTGWWTAPLYRVAWNGSGTPTLVGRIELAPIAPNRFMFTWQLEGQQGSEVFDLLSPLNSCPSLNGQATNLAGNWFAPAQSGYGVDVVALPSQQFDTFYLYDGLGNPRWVIGANGPFAAHSTLAMLQSTGFCPLCAWQPLTTRAAGNLTMSFADATSGTLTSAITLQAPLGGTWNVSQPVLRLTGTSACQ